MVVLRGKRGDSRLPSRNCYLGGREGREERVWMVWETAGESSGEAAVLEILANSPRGTAENREETCGLDVALGGRGAMAEGAERSRGGQPGGSCGDEEHPTSGATK